MRKIRYSAGVKAIMLALQELLSVLLVICIVLVTKLFDSSMLDIRDLQDSSFWDSGYYNSLFERSVKDLMSYRVYKDQFETEGNYNPNKAVNVVAYQDAHIGSRNSGTLLENGKFRYYLSNLEDWSKNYSKTVYQVESQLYTTENDELHQKQILYLGGKTVWESDEQIEGLEDLDDSLLQMLVSTVEYYYGGNYNLEEYGVSFSSSSSAVVYTEVKESAQIMTETADSAPARETPREDAGAGSLSGEDAEAGSPSGEDAGTGSLSGEDSEAGSPPREDNGEGSPSEEDNPSQETVSLEHVIQEIRDGKLFYISQEELMLVLQDLNLLDQTSSQEFHGIQEDYLTAEGTGILEECLAGSITVDEMRQVYNCLGYTLENIGNEINAYRKLANRFGQEESNLKYWIYNERQNQYYTNLSGQEAGKELLAYGKELGSYFYYNKSEVRLDTNVRGMEDTFYENIDAYAGGGNQVIFLGVDKKLPYEDLWKKSEQEYLQLQPWAMASLILMAVSVCGLFLSFVYLGLAAGRRMEGEETHLTWFEKIKTEFLLLAFGIFGIGSVFLISRLIYEAQTSDTLSAMIMGGGIVFSMVAVFDILYMSLVRRVKAGTMWTGSLMHWFGDSIHRIMANRSPSLRILLGFGLHTAAIILLGCLLGNGAYWNNDDFVVCAVMGFLLLSGWEIKRFLREGIQRNALIKGIRQIAAGDLEYKIDTGPLKGDNRVMGEAVNTIGEGLFHAVDDSVKNERLKADLITNVSHDIKTPLTSIINYVDLLRRENLENERARNYIQILDAKSQRLKQLTEDLVEVSRISSGNITLQMDRLNLVELVYQSAGEFAERFAERNLTVVTKLPGEPVIIMADGRRIWRVLENLYNNVAKYAMENTRVYVDMEVIGSEAVFSIKNISRQALNIDASELTERFIRGDVSRSTEGSGLGLSIAQNLANLMGGDFQIYLDGDLFKVTVAFPIVKEDEKSEP